MTRFVVQERDQPFSAAVTYVVVDSEDRHRPVASFGDRERAQAHADRLEEGPFDWDEQAAWADDDDWGRPTSATAGEMED